MKTYHLTGLTRNRRSTAVEPLEARIAPAAVFWDGGGDGVNWNSANNWSNNAVPTSLDDVTINPGGLVTVAITAGAQAVLSLSMPGDDALSITGGSLALAGASAINNLALGVTGALFANAALSLTGTSSLSGSATLGVFIDEDGDTYTVALSGPGTLNVVLLDPDNDGFGTIDQLFLIGSTTKSKVTVAVKRGKDGPDPDKLPDGDGIIRPGFWRRDALGAEVGDVSRQDESGARGGHGRGCIHCEIRRHSASQRRSRDLRELHPTSRRQNYFQIRATHRSQWSF
jgi:hypothetical protein